MTPQSEPVDLSLFERETLARVAFAHRPFTVATARAALRQGGYYGLIQRKLLGLADKSAKRSVLFVTTAGRAALRAQACWHCGATPSACLGQYESMREPQVACDLCCGHGCEDGRCVQLAVEE